MSLTDIQHHHITTNTITLHTVMAGPEDGPPVILLHGFPEFWYGWQHQIPALADAGYRVIVPDQRGYHLSDKPKGVKAYRIAHLAADITGLADALGIDRFYLAGHDWGAAVAWWTAASYPERIHKLAILNVPHPVVMRRFLSTDREQRRKSWYIFFFQLPWLPELFLKRMGAQEFFTRTSHPDTFAASDFQQYQQAWAQPGALSGMINWYRAMTRPQLDGPRPDHFPRITMPALILWGKKDAALTHRMVAPSLDLCDDGRVVYFENATHWVQHDEAQAVNRHLIDHFKP